ncbi:unnamed protein product [Euphydryas editha]|uniref:Endonuclease-reverse transcriptase n=1 Tax=Euphydryas editha TaxID=104508 RepID=A0AAU9UUV1_EUPED|nr:unnamed protein product [Euphydryas editha]
MEDITKILKSIQLELAEQKKDMKEIEINITNTINKNINERFKIIEHKYDQLNEQIQNQEKILDRMERHNRKKNLVFFGIEEGEKSYQELENKILKFLNEVNIPCERNEIEEVKRLGRNKEKPRPITVTFTTIGKKIILLQNKKNNKNSSVYYKEDYPHKVLEKRKQLKIELQKYKADGKKAIIKYDKLIVLNDYNTNKNQKNQQQSKKRNL